MILYILPYLGEGTLVSGKMFARTTCLASHLFYYLIEILNIEPWWIFFPFRVFGLLFASANLLTRRYASSSKRFLGWHFGFLERKKLTSSNVVTSSWVRFVPSCTSHKEGTMSLPIAYFLPMPPTQHLWSSWQNQNLCRILNPRTFGNTLITNITRSRNAPLSSPWNNFCLVIALGVPLQCQTLGIGLRVTSFNVPNIVTTKAFPYFNVWFLG